MKIYIVFFEEAYLDEDGYPTETQRVLDVFVNRGAAESFVAQYEPDEDEVEFSTSPSERWFECKDKPDGWDSNYTFGYVIKEFTAVEER